MNTEKISSLHDDLLVPKATEHLGEYSSYPERFNPEDKSVLTRLEQFGIDIPTVEEKFGKKISEFSWEEYSRLVAESVRGKYDVIVGSVFDSYMFPNPENPDRDTRWNKMVNLVGQYQQMGESCGINLIKRGGDFKDQDNLVLGLEAGAHLIQSIEDLKILIDLGVKIFGFQYNKPTPLADTNGLTELGVSIAKYIFDHNLIIDLAHSNFNTRRDIMILARDLNKGNLVSYTHGSIKEDIDEAWRNKMGDRALTSEEMTDLISMGGIIGLGVTKPFFSSTRKVAERIDATAQITGGIDSIAIGTDFGGIPPEFLNEIKNPDDFSKLADILSAEFNLNDEQIKKVLRTNARDWIQKAIE
jgi:microsomal dipeptidase-like Zn-dependent dipeptidase